MQNAKNRGLSLVELTVTIFVFSLLATACALIVTRGLEYFLDSGTSLEIRQQALTGMTRMTRELKDSNIGSTQKEDTPNEGVVFPSIRDLDNKTIQSNDGKIVWQSFVCYYVAAHLDGRALFRRQEMLGSTDFPDVPYFRPPDPYGNATPRNPAYFQAQAGAGRLVCRRVEKCEFVKNADSLDIRLFCKLSERHAYNIELRTKVVPRL